MRGIFFALTLALLAGPACAQDAADLEAVVTTDLGTFRFEFAPTKAPKHVAQFLKLAREGYYDNGAFFRVVARALIQGGDPLLKNPKTPRNLWGTGALNMLAGEPSDYKHDRGVVSTVKIPGKANSDGAQFFVCVNPQPQLDGEFSAFGKVTEGIDVVEKISQVPAGANQFTDTPVRIRKITIEKKKVEPFLHASIEELKRTVTMKTTLGTLRIQTEPDWAPETVRNFLKLVDTGWYNGTDFHRIAKGFVVQGGMGQGRSSGPTHVADRWVHTIKGEFNKDVKHTRGTVSMARGDEPDSASTSFFLVLGASPHLDGVYAAFGRVIEGLDVLGKFEEQAVEEEKPKTRLEIIEAVVDPK